MSTSTVLRIDATRRAALVRDWSGLFKQFRRARKDCERSLSEKHVHELRLAARHCLPVVEILRAMHVDNPKWEKAYRKLRDLLDALGVLRDAQVRELHLRAMTRRPPRKLIAWLKIEQHMARPRVRKALPMKLSPGDLKGSAAERLVADGKRFATALRNTLARRRQRVERRWKAINIKDPRSLHRARVALKRYRYLLLAIEPCFSTSQKKRLARLKRIQGSIGDWHDAHLFNEWLLSTGKNGVELYKRRAKPDRERHKARIARLLARRHTVHF